MRKTVSKIIFEFVAFLWKRDAAVLCLSALIAILFATLAPQRVQAQWVKTLTFKSNWDRSGAVYFLDKEGAPNVGFVGTDFSIFRTSDGGYTWKEVPDDFGGPNDFAFKDSVTGWTGNLKTTDGGLTWTVIPAIYYKGVDGTGIYYDKKTDGIFLSTYGGAFGGWNPVSWDEGTTWTTYGVNVGGEASGGFAFANDDTGLLAWDDYPQDNTWYRTMDGGRNWSPLHINDSSCFQPLAIQGTNTYFANSSYGSIMRTDDAGNTWTKVYTFPPQFRIPDGEDVATSSSCIRGNIDSLYVMLCSGCYLSTDQGISWKYLCGIPDLNSPVQRFYVTNNRIYVFSGDTLSLASNQYYSSLWMLNLDSIQYFPTGIQLPGGGKDTTVLPGSPVTVNFVPKTSDPIAFDSGRLAFRFDSAALSLVGIKLPVGWRILYSSATEGMLILDISADSNETIPSPMVSLQFRTYLSPGVDTAKIYLDSASLYGHRQNCDCEALSFLRPDTISHSAPDSVQINFLLACGDPTILAAMESAPPFSIESIVPNPAFASLRIEGRGQRVEAELFDALGRKALRSTLYTLPFTLDVSALPSGTYFLRLSQNGYVQSREVSIEH